MNRITLAIFLSIFGLAACQPKDASDNGESAQTTSAKAETHSEQTDKLLALNTDKAKISYAIGANMAKTLAQVFKKQPELGAEIDKQLISRGFEEALADQSQMDDAAIQQAIQDFQTRMIAKAKEKQQKQAQENLEKGKLYLEDNAKKEGWKVTKSGLQYKVIEPGQGAQPKHGDQVVVHYKGTLIDGTQFDSSYDRQQPAVFGVDQVIPGWTEALLMMKKGAKYQLAIPPALAYGEEGRGPIPPNSVLLFDVELLDVQPGKSATAEKKEEPAPNQSASK
ncbi:MAG: FKBP-type peptidyl-prolyl cis-trans isomerase [Gammaproteobacteria bacterium]|nr:MAG: FKBP-type peptidyl-prolyl cis-trans isomerase [Gammaproteobacteria bacterium]